MKKNIRRKIIKHKTRENEIEKILFGERKNIQCESNEILKEYYATSVII